MSLPTTTKEYFWTKFGGTAENLSLRESPLEPMKSHEVLVKIHAVSLQFRDILVGSGPYSAKRLDQLVPCSDMAGEVLAVGKDAGSEWKKGDRVCANFLADHIAGETTLEILNTAHGGSIQGVLTQYRSFRSHSLIKIPDHLSYEEASTLPCAALTAYNALMGPSPVKGGDTVLILGTGGVSIHGLQFALASGARVIATSSSDEKLKIVSKLGAHHIINYKSTPEWHEKVLELTGGRGVDHILEVGGAGSLEHSLKCIRLGGGWIHMIGFVGGSVHLPTDNRFRYSIMKLECLTSVRLHDKLTVRGIQIGSVALFKDMNRLLAQHPEITRPVIDKVFPFEEARKAYEYLQSQAHVGKVVIKVA
ncbi:NAD(P)-binding protein [Gymnopus androsaceus JB14]|uniref:NAD(P)-binding protein n=1 Tax=Gymnopus androsaceus JB14 TaxID=1447944 RepID=A0A6A4I9V8_9AGAR|nr:NAD(P)-binding protein [Gymnopus androsaceus JB14]